MQIDKAREELHSYRKLYGVIKTKKQRLDELKAKAYSIKILDYTKDVVQGGSGEDWKIDILSQMDDLAHEISKDILDAERKGREIEANIDKLPYPCNEVLSKRYIGFKSFELIAVEMSYSYRQTKRIHRRGLEQYLNSSKDVPSCPL